MARNVSLNLNTKQTQNIKQNQVLMMHPRMQQAIALLQAPVAELAAMIDAELEQNPILEYVENDYEEVEIIKERDPSEIDVVIDDNDFSPFEQLDEIYMEHFAESDNYSYQKNSDDAERRAYFESLIQVPENLYHHLMQQVEETFENPREQELAKQIVGNIDDKGYLQSSLDEIAVVTESDRTLLQQILDRIQTFEPHGVGATSIQESLLIQLKCRGQQNSLAYQIVEKFYDDMIHNRIPKIQKGLKVPLSAIQEALDRHIVPLDVQPGMEYGDSTLELIIPDATIFEEEGKLLVDSHRESVPPLRLNKRYLEIFYDENVPKETKDYIKEKLTSAKWLMKNIFQREDTLTRIVQYIARKQSKFFLDPKGQLVPNTMKEVAEELELHESTIARAVANKYVDTPRGTLSLRSFFSNSYTTASGDEMSSNSVRDVLKKLVDHEDPYHPLSDQKLSDLLKEQGIPCARRTVAKYRQELNIGNTQQRRKYGIAC